MNAAILTFRRAVPVTARDTSFPWTGRSVRSVRDRPLPKPALVCRWHRDADGRLVGRWELVASADPECRSAAARSLAPITRAAA